MAAWDCRCCPDGFTGSADAARDHFQAASPRSTWTVEHNADGPVLVEVVQVGAGQVAA